uniref:Uncharacterized protein n=1 Tax=Panagrolaimus sp. PS1159 TaxID=55785 RepID=A0AC35FPK9_9BILA
MSSTEEADPHDLSNDTGKDVENKFSLNERKRIHSLNEEKNVSENDLSFTDTSDNEMDETLYSKTKRQRLTSAEALPQEMPEKIRKPFYEIIEGIFQKAKRKRLVIFLNEDKKYCYEYYWSKSDNRYLCCGCIILNRKSVRAQIQYENTEKEYVKHGETGHICTPREYATLKIHEKIEKIVRAPDFVIQTFVKYGIERKILFLFDQQNRELGYEYHVQKTTGNFLCLQCVKAGQYVVAKFHLDEKNGNYIELSEEEHVCELRPYKDINEHQDIILNESNFKIYPNSNETKLFVFNSKEKNDGYEFSCVAGNSKSFRCLGCQAAKKNAVTLHLSKNADNEIYLRMAPNQTHQCKLRQYSNEKWKETYVYYPNFIFYTKKTSKYINVAILDSNNKKLCYDFQYDQKNVFYCKGCRKLKKSSVYITLHFDDEGKEYIKLKGQKHSCTPVKLATLKGSGIKIQEKSGLKEEGKTGGAVDEGKIVKEEKFLLRPNKIGILNAKLFVFSLADKNLYISALNVQTPIGKDLRCSGCGLAKKHIGAKICSDETGETYVELDESRHICKPENLLKSEVLIKRDNFEQSVKDDGNQIITTFHGKNRTSCRTFFYDKELQVFFCPNCKEKDRIVTAKIIKRNDNNEYLLLYCQHICKPVPCSSNLKKQRKGVKLLIVDENQKLHYYGFCKISINAVSKWLNANPKIEDFKPVCASFDSSYAREKNILFVDSELHKFALVFSSEGICEKVMNNICKSKTNIQQQIFKEKFLVPLLDEYGGNGNVTKIIDGLMNVYNDQKRNEIIKFLQEKSFRQDLLMELSCKYLIVESYSVGDNTVQNTREPENNGDSNVFNDAINDNNSNYSSDGEFEEDEYTVKKKKPRVYSTTKKKIKKHDYELVKGLINGEKKTRLIIFESDRKFCYEYFWNTTDSSFYCCGCTSLRERKVRAIVHNANTKNEYVEFNPDHVCQAREYANLKIFSKQQIVRAPDFEVQTIRKNGNERKNLIIFDTTNRTLCYKYSVSKMPTFVCQKCAYQGHRVCAYLRVDENGTEYVVLGIEGHICDLSQYIPVNANDDIIYESSLFEIFSQQKNKPKLFIFKSMERKHGYLFSHLKENVYQCLGCAKIPGSAKHITVELCQNERNENFLRMKATLKHVCKVRQYQPQKWKKNFVYPPNFFFYTKGTKHPHMVIYCTEDKKFCYDYKFDGKNVMICKECHRRKHYQSALVFQDSDGHDYLQLGSNEHICKPVEYDDVEGDGLTVLPSSGIVYQKQISRKSGIVYKKQISRKSVDQSKIVKSDGFILESENGILTNGTKLYVYDKTDKSLCYKYSFQNRSKRFRCLKCHLLNLTVSAKLCTNEEDNTKYLELGENDHKCKAEKYDPKNIAKKITDFIVYEPNKKWITSKLVVFTSSNHLTCYAYSFCNTRKHFICRECLSSKQKKIVSTKIFRDENDGKDYVLFNEQNHICKPIKYNPMDYEELPKIPSSRFELLPNLWGTPDSRLFIFDVQNPNLCYEFSKAGQNFECRKCLEHPNGKKYTRANLIKNDAGESFIEMDETQHVCKIQDFKASKRLFTADQFEKSINSKEKEIITVFIGKNKNLCYKFSYDDKLQVFRCLQCKGKHITAKICKRKNEEEYFLLNYEHCCKALARNFYPNNC